MTMTSMESVAVKVTTFALLWVQLEDRSQSFVQFLENVTKDDFDEYLAFWARFAIVPRHGGQSCAEARDLYKWHSGQY